LAGLVGRAGGTDAVDPLMLGVVIDNEFLHKAPDGDRTIALRPCAKKNERLKKRQEAKGSMLASAISRGAFRGAFLGRLIAPRANSWWKRIAR
jgi:hypothetical protein